ncbi:MAG TPA: hypothetical protein ENJ20_00765, partial [Bacteroidetes bacterium]|nr:hypothetical protein [Bacteroidota bacterium]
MKSKHLLPVLFCAIFSIQLVAQSDGLRDALSWRWAWQNFQYPITENHSTDDYTTGAEVAYSAWLNRWLDVAIPLRFGKADLPLDQLGNKVTNRFIASLGMQLHLNITPTGSLIQPYLLGGASLLAEGFRGGTVNPEFPFGLGLN